ncbi:hypothetical protein C7B82_12210 [Stenomitos frigidus ULC18]|uniref:HEAT repeat domain-containing protein n=2 Tax=Stenomitos TaxID=1844270 RepID=A0A2T1E8R4_9CYAN|nr:hypothetical protein C7B82_12210 [Stenomitos frigidus ULC18]
MAAGISLAVATSVFAQVVQPKQPEPTRSEVTPLSRDRTNGNGETKVCADADVERYVSKLGTANLTNADFDALVKCGAQAVPALSQALKSDRAEVRASAAYALGQVGQEAYVAVPRLVMMLRDDSSTDYGALTSGLSINC